MLKNIGNFNNTNDYLPLFNAVLITDLFVILLLRTSVIKSQVLNKWYSQYNLSAVIADVLIILIGLIIARAIYYYIFDKFSLFKFMVIAVIVQIIHDILFYVLFTSTPRGVNKMLDTFKDYANETSYKAILADSGMMIMSCLLASYLVNRNTNTNIIVLISSLYLLPYLLYK
uniref:Uncharacterized protein n=1 Tax=viral metagenome TaxID=1070528 RepID=A0A6C0E2F4_9ZZZZ